MDAFVTEYHLEYFAKLLDWPVKQFFFKNWFNLISDIDVSCKDKTIKQ